MSGEGDLMLSLERGRVVLSVGSVTTEKQIKNNELAVIEDVKEVVRKLQKPLEWVVGQSCGQLV